MATLHKIRKGASNNRGLTVRYDVSDIYLKESIFTDGGFFDAVATYVHESCHAFGGDSSESFSLALTHAMEMLLARPELVADYERQWHGVFAAQEAPAPQTTPALQTTWAAQAGN